MYPNSTWICDLSLLLFKTKVISGISRHTRCLSKCSHPFFTSMLSVFFCGRPTLPICSTIIWALLCNPSFLDFLWTHSYHRLFKRTFQSPLTIWITWLFNFRHSPSQNAPSAKERYFPKVQHADPLALPSSVCFCMKVLGLMKQSHSRRVILQLIPTHTSQVLAPPACCVS